MPRSRLNKRNNVHTKASQNAAQYGQLSASSGARIGHASSSMLPAWAAAANTCVVRAVPAPSLSTSQATAGRFAMLPLRAVRRDSSKRCLRASVRIASGPAQRRTNAWCGTGCDSRTVVCCGVLNCAAVALLTRRKVQATSLDVSETAKRCTSSGSQMRGGSEPCSASHSSCSSLPPSAAAAKTIASHGQPFSRSHASSSMLPAWAAAANTRKAQATSLDVSETAKRWTSSGSQMREGSEVAAASCCWGGDTGDWDRCRSSEESALVAELRAAVEAAEEQLRHKQPQHKRLQPSPTSTHENTTVQLPSTSTKTGPPGTRGRADAGAAGSLGPDGGGSGGGGVGSSGGRGVLGSIMGDALDSSRVHRDRSLAQEAVAARHASVAAHHEARLHSMRSDRLAATAAAGPEAGPSGIGRSSLDAQHHRRFPQGRQQPPQPPQPPQRSQQRSAVQGERPPPLLRPPLSVSLSLSDLSAAAGRELAAAGRTGGGGHGGGSSSGGGGGGARVEA
ncbi:hypothetical protein TSOC_008239 [Tetrabaena socialis]|uniref:Uncharacterized protein n=1 Tax=Tetrabaena socialis TaxID=47790 RepID=A0A2J7ZYZ4_9CHLO|nr:hypothetical protein TSOC_008239 [Tetrabaena socialis]|eukprot:PNH05494.1 hypothetical protein TSOC_008239 [Tetrabaena socialis]